MTEPEFLTVKQLMERYGVSETTIHRWKNQGVLPRPLHIGGLVRWRLADIVTHEKFFETKPRGESE